MSGRLMVVGGALWACALAACGDDGVTPAGSGSGGAAASTAANAVVASSSAATGGQGGSTSPSTTLPRVLLFSKTAGFRHDAIADATSALETAATTRGWPLVDATEDASVFSTVGLAGYDVVVFLLTSGDVLDAGQEAAFEAFIAAGGGFVGVHSASDTEYDWPWYQGLVGATFAGHPAVQGATLRVERERHLATRGLSGTWARDDEWYSFSANPRADVMVLLSLDESSYAPGGFAMGDHPIAWCQHYGGGRSFYSALGHTPASWADSAFVDHVAGGIEWAHGREHESAVVTALDGRASAGDWQPIGSGPFTFEASAAGLTMSDEVGANQHLVLDGVDVDASRPYVMEALFSIPAPLGPPPNSFAFNLNMPATGSVVSTWSINVDLNQASPGGVMKHMGFNGGAFASLGDTFISWGEPDREYQLRVAVDGTQVDAQVFEAGVTRESFSVDYGAFVHQPGGAPVRVGANTHGTDWTMRGLRVYYLD